MVEKHSLAVDDDPMMRQLIADYLSGHGFRVSAVARGQEMAHAIEEDVVDLIVLDLKLAEEDGLQLVRAEDDVEPADHHRNRPPAGRGRPHRRSRARRR